MDNSYLGGKLKDLLEKTIKEAIKQGYDTFYTGMAQGFDIIAAEAVIKCRGEYGSPASVAKRQISLIAVIPYRGQEESWGKKWKERHDKILRAADKIEVLNETLVTGCFHERNRYLADHATLLISLFSGKQGGTRHTTAYAQEKGLQIINLWDSL
jgi:uncharacterized phage-like protein YoqJ